jgi:two-component system CheB/CheR fusion protein
VEELSVHKEYSFILSHDFRTLIAGITATAEYLDINFDEMDKITAKEMLHFIQHQRELDLLDYLIEWARIKYASEAFAPVIELFNHVKKVFDT